MSQMNREEYEEMQEELRCRAKTEGAWYYDPESPAI